MSLFGAGGLTYLYWNGSYVGIVDDINRTVVAGQAKSPQQAVRGYLQALAHGNAEDALKFAAYPPSANRTFLTDDVLNFCNTLSPISNILTFKNMYSTKDDIIVDVTYNVGLSRTLDSFHIVSRDGYFFLSDATVTVDLSASFVPDVSETLNGIPFSAIPSQKMEMFPGAYEISFGNPLLEITWGASFIVHQSKQSVMFIPAPTFDLATGAQGKLADIARKALNKCMAETNTMTTCGFGNTYITDIKTGKRVNLKPHTAKWTFRNHSNADFKGTDFSLDSQYPSTIATATISLYLRDDYAITNGQPYWSTYTLQSVTIDFTDPDKPQVTFEGINTTK